MSPRLPIALVAASLLHSGCGWDGPWLQTWWGDLETEAEGAATFDAGAASALTGLSYPLPLTDGTDAEVWVLTGSWAPGSCDVHRAHFRELEALVAEADGIALNADGAAWICDRLGGLAREAYGADGAHRAIHALVHPPEAGGTLRPAPTDLETDENGAWDPNSVPPAGTFVGRVLEWGAAQIPGADTEPGGRCTAAVLGAWAEDGAVAADGVRAGAFRLYGHRHAGEEQVGREGDDPQPIGLIAQGVGDEREVNAHVFTDAPAIAGSPYPQMIVGTLDAPVSLEPCPEAADFAGWALPELASGGAE